MPVGCNNLQVDVEHIDNDIPRLYWNYVRATSPSISVSFWWGAGRGVDEVGGGGDMRRLEGK